VISDDESVSSDESVESVEMPVKRYATRSQNASKVIKSLKEDNLKMVKDKLKKDESEQVRYLSLDNATKDIEIENLQLAIMDYERIIKPMKQYEESFKNIEKNVQTYKRLIDEVISKEYSDLLMSESHEIIVINKPVIDVPEIKYCINSLDTMYTNKYNLQTKLCNEFHEKMLQESINKRRLYKVIDYSIILSLVILYICSQYYFNK
jgi:hypothetical protein